MVIWENERYSNSQHVHTVPPHILFNHFIYVEYETDQCENRGILYLKKKRQTCRSMASQLFRYIFVVCQNGKIHINFPEIRSILIVSTRLGYVDTVHVQYFVYDYTPNNRLHSLQSHCAHLHEYDTQIHMHDNWNAMVFRSEYYFFS